MKIFFYIISLFFVISCASTKDLAKKYFYEKSLPKGVKPVAEFLEQKHNYKALQELMYGKDKTYEINTCTILRNQLYIAALASSNTKINEAAKSIESGYESSDEEFLVHCRQVSQSEIGKIFLVEQQNYLQIVTKVITP